ncbi:BnaC05g48270D [Brassica napus]|uniref:BnaC05g48270D protein n=1 Tax=Brassica napus TaxID=3708 RepID=A0A078I0X9_BRANA|nr:BnaC05g48270D [Brassica napus]
MTPNLRSVYWHDWVQENQRKYDENIEYFERSEKMWAQFAAEDRLRSRAALVSDRKLFGLGCLRAGHFSDRFSSDNFGSVRILDSMPMTNFSFTPFEREEAKPKFLIMPPSNLRAVVAQMYRGGSRNLSSSPLGSRMNVLRRQRMLDKQIESNNLLREQVIVFVLLSFSLF